MSEEIQTNLGCMRSLGKVSQVTVVLSLVPLEQAPLATVFQKISLWARAAGCTKREIISPINTKNMRKNQPNQDCMFPTDPRERPVAATCWRQLPNEIFLLNLDICPSLSREVPEVTMAKCTDLKE